MSCDVIINIIIIVIIIINIIIYKNVGNAKQRESAVHPISPKTSAHNTNP